MQRASKSIDGGRSQPSPFHPREKIFDHLRCNLRNLQPGDFGIENVPLEPMALALSSFW